MKTEWQWPVETHSNHLPDWGFTRCERQSFDGDKIRNSSCSLCCVYKFENELDVEWHNDNNMFDGENSDDRLVVKIWTRTRRSCGGLSFCEGCTSLYSHVCHWHWKIRVVCWNFSFMILRSGIRRGKRAEFMLEFSICQFWVGTVRVNSNSEVRTEVSVSCCCGRENEEIEGQIFMVRLSYHLTFRKEPANKPQLQLQLLCSFLL